MMHPDESNHAVPTQILQYLLERIEENQIKGFDRIEKALADKADKADVFRLSTQLNQHSLRLDDHQKRIETIEGDQHDEDVRVRTVQEQKIFHLQFKHRIWIALSTIGIIAATVLSGWVGTHI